MREQASTDDLSRRQLGAEGAANVAGPHRDDQRIYSHEKASVFDPSTHRPTRVLELHSREFVGWLLTRCQHFTANINDSATLCNMLSA